eukprot:644742-Ditylum_brightwellii.AAC.1
MVLQYAKAEMSSETQGLSTGLLPCSNTLSFMLCQDSTTSDAQKQHVYTKRNLSSSSSFYAR